MRILKDNPAFESPLEKLASYFSSGDLFYSADTYLAFVCGAAGATLADGSPSMRSEFMRHVELHYADRILCIKAEEAVSDLFRQQEERNSNLAHFEKLIASTVNSVVVFPESPGSFAELGYFSAFPEICKKTIVGVRAKYQDNSFISLWPIHYISSVSNYRPLPIALGDDYEAMFSTICERIAGNKDQRPYRKRFEKKVWKGLDSRERLAVTDEIISIAAALTEVDLRHIIYASFGSYDISELRMLLSLLVASGRVARNGDGDVFSKSSAVKTFMESQDRVPLKGRWLNALKESSTDGYAELEAIRNG